VRSTLEQQARAQIDRLLIAAGWRVCGISDVNIQGARGVVMAAILLVAALLSSLALADVPAGVDPTAAGRGQPFWLTLAKDCTVPAGESAAGLVREAINLLGSPDPTWRDDVGYGVIVSCVYQKKLLDTGQRREIVDRLMGNLRPGIGEAGTDTVLLRSFSALDLSILAALELQDPVLDAAWLRMTAPGTPVFRHAEDERLAAALLSVMRRPDFDAASLEPWLERFVALEKSVWQPSPPEATALDAAQNARNLLRSLHLLLVLPRPDPTPDQLVAREKVVVTLQQIRR